MEKTQKQEKKLNIHQRIGRTALIWLGVSALCGLFAFIYQQNSHDITSAYMTFAFVPPLVLGFMVYGFMYLFHIGSLRLSGTVYQSGIITVTVGMISVGIFKIYGTDNALLPIYFYAGVTLLLAGVVAMLMGRFQKVLK